MDTGYSVLMSVYKKRTARIFEGKHTKYNGSNTKNR